MCDQYSDLEAQILCTYTRNNRVLCIKLNVNVVVEENEHGESVPNVTYLASIFIQLVRESHWSSVYRDMEYVTPCWAATPSNISMS